MSLVKDMVVNPPDREWKEETMRYLERWTRNSLEYKEDSTVIKVDIDPPKLLPLRGMDTAFLEPFQKLLLVHKTFTVTLERL